MAGEILLTMKNIVKTFPGVKALNGIDLMLRSGEVLALMGENGAGKSTLMKVLGGAYQPDSGHIEVQGKPVSIPTPAYAQKNGIGIIYQEFNLIPALSACENIFLGREVHNWGFIRMLNEYRQAMALFYRIGINIPPNVPCRDLTVAQQQVVEIAKALSLQAKILVMDEPTAALTNQEVSKLFVIINDLKKQGIGIIYISHRMDEIFQISDQVMVMRDGEYVGTKPTKELKRERLIEMMVGRKLENEFPVRKNPKIGDVRLEVTGLNRPKWVHDVSMTVRAGEILGLTGLVGAGRSESVRIFCGADKGEYKTLLLDGKPLKIKSARDGIDNGILLVSEHRKLEGLVMGNSVRDNFGLPNFDRLSRKGFINLKKEDKEFSKFVKSLSIKIPTNEALAGNLSGGNQQKVVLAKWLYRDFDVIIFDEPTRGIDVGAKFEIYQIINELADAGKVIILISSEMPEILGLSTRILVMHGGRITGEITDVKNATQEQIMELAVV